MMSRRVLKILLLIQCVFLGWILGFIKVPYLGCNSSFWIGFSACILILSFITTLSWLQNPIFLKKIFGFLSLSDEKLNLKQLLLSKILISILTVGILALGFINYTSQQSLEGKLHLNLAELKNLKEHAGTGEQKIKLQLLLTLVHELDSFKRHAPDKSSVNNMIDRIAALSSSLKIYKEWDPEREIYQDLSSTRGMLLLALIHSRLDSSTFAMIKKNVSFSGVDLRNADLQGLDLSGIEMKFANLQDANLQEINLDNADLRGANLIRVNLNQASLAGTNMIATKLNWSKINEAIMLKVRLDSADLTNATLHKSKLNYATLIHTNLRNAILIEADLYNCSVFDSDLSNANLSKATFTIANISDTRFDGTTFAETIVKKNWFELIKEKNESALNTIFDKYQIVADSLSLPDSLIFRLKPR